MHWVQLRKTFSGNCWNLASDVVSEFFRVYSCNRTMFLQSMNTVALYGRSCNHFATVRIDFFQTLVPYAEKFCHIFQRTYFKYGCTKNRCCSTLYLNRGTLLHYWRTETHLPATNAWLIKQACYLRQLELKAPPDRREMFAATANPSLRILSWTATYTATSGSPHTGAKKSRRRLRNCSDLFTVAACTVLVAVAANSAGFTFQFRELAPAGDKNVLCRQAPEGRSRHFSDLFRIQSHLNLPAWILSWVNFPWRLRKN